MKILFKVGAFIGLSLVLISPLLVWFAIIDLDLNKSMMLAGTGIWFVCAPLATRKVSTE